MASAAKVAANRKNAAKSTGPRTKAGKKTAALNATRHAVLSVVPVLPGVERAEEWEAHQSATIASLAPIGYMETILADRVAALFWRLGRVTRYEVENTASQLETAEAELAEELGTQRLFTWRSGRPVFGTSPDEIRKELEERRAKVESFHPLHELADSEPFPPEHAEAVLLAVAMQANVELSDVELPFLPSEVDDIGWSVWTGWTKELVVRVAGAIVASSTLPGSGAEGAIRTCSEAAKADMQRAETELREVEAALTRKTRERVLLSPEGLERVTRYEAHLERALYRALHEFERLQARRTGTGGAAYALDVDLSVGPRVDPPEVLSGNPFTP